MKTWLLLLCLISVGSFGVVKRHDIPSENYTLRKSPDFLIDMPHEGHGVLIRSQWIITVAHTVFYDYTGKSLKIGSDSFEIETVYIHPDFNEPDNSLFEGDLAPLMSFFKERSDIALIKLSSPVRELKPIDIYTDSMECGKTITVFGKGATGEGLTGENLETKSLRNLHQFQNIVESTEKNWLSFKFDAPPNALPLEGIHGSGDSGGASVIYQNGTPFLVGLSSWQMGQGKVSDFKGGLYGTTAYQVRISSYKDWIEDVIGE